MKVWALWFTVIGANTCKSPALTLMAVQWLHQLQASWPLSRQEEGQEGRELTQLLLSSFTRKAMFSLKPPFPSKALLVTRGHYRVTWPALSTGETGEANT